ncbi:MAG: prolipoprotein diacylglyceryl transferase [Calditerrivibrio sp.]|nr:prolipoprotein diacylglyceryl transferase [Calditerrivibrio sp.]
MEKLFLAVLALFLTILSYIGIKYFPHERFQFLFAFPYKKLSNGSWLSLNITFYGLFNAIAYTTGSLLGVILMLSVGLKPIQILVTLFLIFVICIPASKLIAKSIEKSKSGFTVGGAVFVGVLISPVAVFVASLYGDWNWAQMLLPTISSMAIAYAVGEGIGRLGCLSFGCCYGKAVDDINHPLLRSFFERFYTIYTGRYKKASYSSNLCNKKTVPVQAAANIIYSIVAFLSIIAYIYGFFVLSTLLVTYTTQLYRFFSEFLRADYRGEGRISTYQKMALLNMLIISFYVFLVNADNPKPDINNALDQLSNGWFILSLIIIFCTTLVYTGVSTATYSIINFRLSSKAIQPAKPE